MQQRFVIPLVLAALVGVLGGLGAFTFVYAKGASYLTNDPNACANCHVMQGQLDGWLKSSHKSVATCNDCHTPHSFVDKYFTKALNGFNHSWAFTFQNFHEPIRITKRNRRVTEGQCRECHSAVVDAIRPGGPHERNNISCIGCHRSVGHMH